MNVELTEQEMVYYGNYGLIDSCDCCNNFVPVYNSNDGKNYLTLVGKNLYCQKCMANSSNDKTEVS